MSARIIARPLPAEQIVAVDPQLQQQVVTTWQRRLRMFSGRALSDVALSAEQDYRSGHLSHSGRLLTPGVVSGLGLSVDLSGAAPLLVLGAGQGIVFSGEDVTVPASVRIPLAGVSVFDPQTENTVPSGTGPQTAVSQTFAAFTAAAAAATPRVGLFLLEPITIKFAGNPAGAATDVIDITAQLLTSPDRDPDEYAFEDWQTMDGCRLIFYPWPADKIALPAADALLRNHLAHAVFALEAGFARGDHFPWEEAGVPLGVAVFDDAWKPLFLDASSVVRQGGLPRRVLDTPFENTWPAQNPLLAEAQIQQFLEQNATLPAGNPPAALSANFQFLPPVGILPIAAIDLVSFPTFKNHVFPANYSISAEPIIADELEDYLAQAAELAPFDLTVADSVQLLVPVAQSDYEPALLQQEQVNPEFAKEMATATANRVAALQHRTDLDTKANVMLKVLALPAMTVDADLSVDEQTDLKAAPAYVAPSAEAFGTAVTNNVLGSTDVTALQSTIAAITVGTSRLVPDSDLQTIDSAGLPQFIALLDQRIKQANDIIDLGFLRAQTDIYRYRQLVLDNSAATRLATSSVLTQIAQGSTAAATTDQIDKYFQDASAQKVGVSTTPLAYEKPAKIPLKINIPPGKIGGGGVAVAIESARTRSAALNLAFLPTATVVKAGAGVISAGPLQPSPTLKAITTLAPAISAATVIGAEAAVPAPSAGTVQEQSPVVGGQIDFRSTSVAERLKQSPGQEAAFFTSQNRTDVTLTILSKLPSAMVDDLTVDGVNPADGSKSTHTLHDLRDPALIVHIQVPPIKQDTDEGALFSAGVQMLEQHIDLLRQLEGRVAQFNKIIDLSKQALTVIHSNLDGIDAALKTVEDTLNNARHAYTFTKALALDEQTRVTGVNARRAAVLQHNVPFLVFRRAPTLAATGSEPARQLFPDISGSLLPGCLNRTAPVPSELRQMVNLLRQAPATWMPRATTILPKFERRDLLQGLATRMQSTARLAAQSPPPSSIAISNTVYSDKIDLAYTAHSSVMESFRQQRAGFAVSSLQSATWSMQVNTLLPIISIGDMLGSDLGNLIIRPLARLVDEITGVAACIYDRAAQALPAVRLAWADAFYLESDSADLDDLSMLPHWGELPYEQRREMQMLVSWLFAQINHDVPAALQFMSDVVRVAILLASDAPVTEIIMGSSLEPAPLKLGGLVRVSLPSSRIYQAMPVTIHSNGELIAHGAVNDLAETEAAIQITAVVKTGISTLPSGVSVQYVTQSNWTNAVNAGVKSTFSGKALLQ